MQDAEKLANGSESAALGTIVRERERIVENSTRNFLNLLEAEQRIQSADRIFELAAKTGRQASRVEKFNQHDEATRSARNSFGV